MSVPKSRRAISRAMPSSICVSRAPLKSSTIANRLSGNTRSPARPASSARPPNGLIIDEDLGLSGGGTATRSGFARLTAEVALARVGLVLGLEVSRLARNNAEWYRLIDLAGLTDTLIGDGDGLYHPAVFNDRLLLGLNGMVT